MVTLSRQPTKLDYASPTQFKFSINQLPKVEFFTVSANIPDITLSDVVIPTPFKPIPVLGQNLTYGNLNITFIVDEFLENYRELHEWLTGIGFPNNYDEYKDQKANQIYSDATLSILNSNMQPNYRILFKDLFPISLGEVAFDSASADVDGIKATASFRYLSYSYEIVST